MKQMKHQGDMPVKLGDVKSAPSSKGSPHKDPSYDKISAQMVKEAPSAKKKALPLADAPQGVAGVNGGESIALPKSHTLKK